MLNDVGYIFIFLTRPMYIKKFLLIAKRTNTMEIDFEMQTVDFEFNITIKSPENSRG